MSIIRQLIQIAAVEALRDMTIATDHVFAGSMDSLPGLLKDERRAVLVVSIEEGEQKGRIQSERGLFGRDTVLKLFVQAVVAVGTEDIVKGETVIVAALGETDAAYEALLNILDRQWRQVLTVSETPWALVFRGLVMAFGEIKDARASDPETGTKHAARYTLAEIEVLDEPLPGSIPAPVEAGLILMEADGDEGYGEVVRVFRALLSEGADWADWRKTQALLGLDRDRLLALGLGPLAEDEDRTTPPLADGAVLVVDGAEEVAP
ncbi:hypothetical protein HDIA_1987 [Hartmannibacter diazotrophicus]|uniref:Uncharacterized protein n=1 Tax=Hartmannibacter diazotrophicus TaxID=1482074 RepID=A0A2C9D5V7_9HYPH|nr:hypothetical protein [Hartmannibacter diazotrophicus]SON55528.1 hypothetical protein HDIA_1987 [Hartmannibacter diazotrophicus]